MRRVSLYRTVSRCGISPPESKTTEKSMRFSVYLVTSRDFKLSSTRCELFPSRVTSVFSINTAIMCPRVSLLLLCSFLLLFVGHRCEENVTSVTEENALAKLVKMFSKPGAFNRINAILGENSIEESSASCPKGEEGLECRRAEARRSVDCPQGDCYCYNCAAAGPELWASCCRESLRCCSHLAAACRTCDHPSLYPFCSKHFKKCLDEPNAKKQN